ncbi:MAG: SnoaL-like domain [Myxococcales bacterium]|nr:SnoaL-like domain [Myxococcales bacterium]
MRNLTFALAILVAGAAHADKGESNKGGDKSKDAAASAKATLDKFDEAWNAHDAKATASFLDKSFFGAGPYVSAKIGDADAARTQLEKDAASGARIVRNAIVIKADDSGDTAWYIGDYMFSPKVPPGALPVRRPMRVTGTMVRRGKDWKLSMSNISAVQPDPPASAQNQAATPPSGEATKK